MKKRVLLIFWVAGSIFFNSCSKVGSAEDDNDTIDHSDNVFPNLTVIRPINNQVYNNGDTIYVEGEVSDEKLMYRGRIRLTDDANGFVLKEEFYETHIMQTISFNFYYKATVASVSDYTIAVEFEDHGLNRVTATYKVKVNP